MPRVSHAPTTLLRASTTGPQGALSRASTAFITTDPSTRASNAACLNAKMLDNTHPLALTLDSHNASTVKGLLLGSTSGLAVVTSDVRGRHTTTRRTTRATPAATESTRPRTQGAPCAQQLHALQVPTGHSAQIQQIHTARHARVVQLRGTSNGRTTSAPSSATPASTTAQRKTSV
jgi:hypothetical protein